MRERDFEPAQPEFSFGGGPADGRDGLNAWRHQRRAALEQLGRDLGLPMGREVEVWLRNGIRLRGILRLREDLLFLEAPKEVHLDLVVDGVVFRQGEIESCVRLD